MYVQVLSDKKTGAVCRVGTFVRRIREGGSGQGRGRGPCKAHQETHGQIRVDKAGRDKQTRRRDPLTTRGKKGKGKERQRENDDVKGACRHDRQDVDAKRGRKLCIWGDVSLGRTDFEQTDYTTMGRRSGRKLTI